MPVPLLWLFGYLEVEIAGRQPERLLNLAYREGVAFWRVRRTPWGATGCVGLLGFRRLRPLARRSGCRVRIRRRVGLPFLCRRLRQRRLFLATMLLVLVALHLLGGRVWVVEVRGAGRVDAARIEEAAARLGLRPGVARTAVDPRRVGADLPLLVPELAWAGVRLRGTRAVIEVVERAVLPPGYRPADEPGDVVARRDGLVTHILVLAGEPLVREGEAVTAGQVLIRGVVREAAGGEPRKRGGVLAVRARGIVRGRVWYELEEVEPLLAEEPVPTGRGYVRRLVRVGSWRLAVTGRGRVPFADYVARETILRFPRGRSVEPFVEVKIIHYAEVHRRQRRVAQLDAVARAEERLRRRALATLAPGAAILSERTLVRPAGVGAVRVHLLVETEEDLGRFRPAARAGGPMASGGGEGEGETAAARAGSRADARSLRAR